MYAADTVISVLKPGQHGYHVIRFALVQDLGEAHDVAEEYGGILVQNWK